MVNGMVKKPLRFGLLWILLPAALCAGPARAEDAGPALGTLAKHVIDAHKVVADAQQEAAEAKTNLQHAMERVDKALAALTSALDILKKADALAGPLLKGAGGAAKQAESVQDKGKDAAKELDRAKEALDKSKLKF